MARLTVFAKGNSDLVESLFDCRGADAAWNGINEAVRAYRPDWRVRLRHETLTRSDALLAATGAVPQALAHLEFEWPYSAASQFSADFFDGEAAAYVLSIQPDVTMTLVRHRATGHLFHPGSARAWPTGLKTWLKAECEVAPLLTPDQSIANLVGVVARLRQRSHAPVLIYNLSSVVPADRIDNHYGLGETLPTRIKRFNLALIALSQQSDVTIVDVDKIAAGHGATRLKLDDLRLNCDGCRLVAEDVLRIFDAHDLFSVPG